MTSPDWPARNAAARAFIAQKREKWQTSWADLTYEYDKDTNDETQITGTGSHSASVAQAGAGAGDGRAPYPRNLDSDRSPVRAGRSPLASGGRAGGTDAPADK